MIGDGSAVGRIIRQALEEDIGPGDATSLGTLAPDAVLQARFLAKADGVVAGLAVAAEVFRALDARVEIAYSVAEGELVRPGDSFGTVCGNARGVLAAERTALNFLQRMSGIATLTRTYVEAVRGTGAVVLDTRKTAPGLRILDKMAVRAGGGHNHRQGLFDMVLIKDNHVDACGGIAQAVGKVRASPYAKLPIEVECRTLADVCEGLSAGVDRLLLDNMPVDTVRQAVALASGATPLEVSGNVTLDNIRQYAETGVSFISVGALTHSVQALDISLKTSLAS